MSPPAVPPPPPRADTLRALRAGPLGLRIIGGLIAGAGWSESQQAAEPASYEVATAPGKPQSS